MVESINKVIKKINKEKENKTYITIDSIRNPLEAFFFQERYSAFYLMAISCNEKDRRERLLKKGYSEEGIVNIDKREFNEQAPDRLEYYCGQDIQGCLQRADIYISNSNQEYECDNYKNMANQILTFVSLMRRPGIITPTPIERCMQIAYNAKLNSGCISRKVGAVVSDENYSIKSVGWNDTPHGQVPCNLRNKFDLYNGEDKAAYSEFELTNLEYRRNLAEANSEINQSFIDSGRNLSYCFKSEYNKIKGDKNQVHTRALHAEENAFLQISKYGGIGIQGGFLFTTASPCELCAKKAYQLGIKKIYYIDPYPGIAAEHILQGGSNRPELILFSGVVGRAFHQLYSPIISYKDEMSAFFKEESQEKKDQNGKTPPHGELINNPEDSKNKIE